MPVFFFISFSLLFLFQSGYLLLVLVPLFGLIGLLAQKLAESTTIIDLGDPEYLKINDQEIPYTSILGYFINDGALTSTAFCLRLDSDKTVQITASSVGQAGKKFVAIQYEIICALKSKIPNLQELEHADVYVRQTSMLRPIIYISIGVILLLDVLAIYLMVWRKMDLPWQLFFANSLILGLVPFLKKGKLKKD
ncbi:MAG: hypothetical protein PHQ74_13290 [Crocinitomicaceae bacterium]|nr:hypothetical protein [Crocinitomicaceae bacterium]